MKFTKFAFIETERKKGASIAASNGINTDIKNKLLISALPSGSPADKFYKIIRLDKSIYLSVLHIMKDQDYGLALVLELTNDFMKKNPIGFVDSIYDLLKKTIKSKDFPNEIIMDYKDIEPVFAYYKDFDVLIFALLTTQKTIIVGEKEELEEFMGTIYECIPPQLRGHINIAANMSNISNQEEISLVPVSERVLRALDNRKEDYTVLMLPLKQAYGLYSSPICKRIAKLFVEEKVESIKEEISYLFKMATESNVIENVAEFAKKKELEIPDASLVQWIRANYFELELEKSILEQLES